MALAEEAGEAGEAGEAYEVGGDTVAEQALGGEAYPTEVTEEVLEEATEEVLLTLTPNP